MASKDSAGRFIRSAGTVSAAVALSRITGMVREMVMARLFGAGEVYDAFLLGMRIPNLARNLFAEGALSAAFVPIFTQYLKTRGKREAQQLSDLTATALILVVGAVLRGGDDLRAAAGAPDGAGLRTRAGQVRTGGAADPHHVSVSAC